MNNDEFAIKLPTTGSYDQLILKINGYKTVCKLTFIAHNDNDNVTFEIFLRSVWLWQERLLYFFAYEGVKNEISSNLVPRPFLDKFLGYFGEREQIIDSIYIEGNYNKCIFRIVMRSGQIFGKFVIADLTGIIVVYFSRENLKLMSAYFTKVL